MTPSLSIPESTVVARLRAAGCVFAEDEARLLLISEASDSAELEWMLKQRVAGLPLEQILGWVEFCGLRIAVQPAVFVPRRRSELLAARAIGLLAAGLDRWCSTCVSAQVQSRQP